MSKHGEEESFQLLMGTDIDGTLRGKMIPERKFKQDQSIIEFGFCGVIFSWDCTDAVYTSTELSRGLDALSSEQIPSSSASFGNDRAGYPDVIAQVDMERRRLLHIPRLQRPIAVNFVDFLGKNRRPLDFCPRSALKAALGSLKESLGMTAECGFELEWYNYHGDAPSVLASEQPPHLTSGMFGYSMLRPMQRSDFVSDILLHSSKSGIALDCFHTETGPGVYEAALRHAPGLKAADDCQLFKYLVKTLASSHGLTASFMAKPWNGLPGCGGHCHISLQTDSGHHNAFVEHAQLMDHFVAGILHCLPDLMPFFAPNINSYKRLDLRYWAPVLVGWGEDNRLAVVRVIRPEDDPKDTRIEVRVAGADLNPYYALAAILKAGIYGVENKLKLPAALQTANLHPNSDLLAEITKQGYKPLPSDLSSATARMMAAESMARKLFPAALIEHFGTTRLHEVKVFQSSITDWERQRYLESA